ncbi:ATP adenylyltransferase family protein [Marinobacterium jannaschii]|uniref:ATP adenylyltransferase family protein n=1 Tax=Marinobacterium jannaschii TaxID=64970 RepID=UPI000483348D|nr:DUF4922 domain-containing protein [Marinobacterium jannaschii]
MNEKIWPQLVAVTEKALYCGALQPIATYSEDYVEQGVNFRLRVLDNLRRKSEAGRRLKKAADHSRNPFLPYEPELYLGELGDHHRLLLNKFNVLPHHLLLVTREFESQNDLLNLGDFSALARLMLQVEGLAFFNGGSLAGASQPHKHLQMIPDLPLPFGDFLDQLEGTQPQRLSALAFRHAAVGLPETLFSESPFEAIARQLEACYQHLVRQLGIRHRNGKALDSYNLLLSRRWMLLVPRIQESVAGISFNALAFSGSILVRRAEELTTLKEYGLMRALSDITGEPQ